MDRGRRQSIYQKYGKRLLDILMALGGIILLSPVLLITAICVRFRLGSPILFRQKRPGKNEKIFEMYKFRTMTDARDQDGNLLPDEERLTKFGKKLRSTSLDELPELLNILKGDMSVVGPRPLLVDYLPRYSRVQHHRHDVRPGLTGLAQIKGRNAIDWDEKFRWDLMYVKNMSLRLDLTILAESVAVVLKRNGIHAEGCETMKEFKGVKTP